MPRYGLRTGDLHPTAATGNRAELFQHEREEGRHRQGVQRQVEALDPKRRQADHHTHDEAHHTGAQHRDRQRRVQLVDHPTRRVGADPKECTMPDRNLSVVSREQI